MSNIDMKQIATDSRFWPSVPEAAEEYCIPLRLLRRLVNDGVVESISLGRTRVNPASIERWAESRYQPGEG